MTPELPAAFRDQHGPAHVVCAFNVFAHADDLSAMAESIRTMLAPEGLFFFEAQYLLDIIDGVLIATIFHEHMSHHSLKPLVQFPRSAWARIDSGRAIADSAWLDRRDRPAQGCRASVSRSVGKLVGIGGANVRLDRERPCRNLRAVKRLREKTTGLVDKWRQEGEERRSRHTVRPAAGLRLSLSLASPVRSNTLSMIIPKSW
jgi:hypothetical protein